MDKKSALARFFGAFAPSVLPSSQYPVSTTSLISRTEIFPVAQGFSLNRSKSTRIDARGSRHRAFEGACASTGRPAGGRAGVQEAGLEARCVRGGARSHEGGAGKQTVVGRRCRERDGEGVHRWSPDGGALCVSVLVGLRGHPECGADERPIPGDEKNLRKPLEILQIVLFVICVIHDVIYICNPTRRKGLPVHLVNVRDWMFSVLVFPIGTFVVFTFWILYAFDRKFIFNQELDGISPSWVNHFIHTTVLPLLLTELIICPHKYPSRKKGVLGLTIFASVYIIWVLWINYTSGIWAYPLLENLIKVDWWCFLHLVTLE
uniref:Androgen-dependent TFPI-regulating protein-like n=1 Tax=Phascolarctos cinereus TaxID=38626 RepID=A0A6P5JY85_PHACI|nr:androgen-dependent TFPI-regulating protein-like [Phascolarctos cinereus]